MLSVEFGPGGEFRLVLRFNPVLAVTPGAATIQITSDVRSANDGHGQSIAQIFYIKL